MTVKITTANGGSDSKRAALIDALKRGVVSTVTNKQRPRQVVLQQPR